MACPTGKVANTTGEVTRIGVRLRLCGQGLRSRSPWLGAEVGWLRALHTGRGSCPQGHDSRYQLHLSWYLDKRASRQAHVCTTATTITTATTATARWEARHVRPSPWWSESRAWWKGNGFVANAGYHGAGRA